MNVFECVMTMEVAPLQLCGIQRARGGGSHAGAAQCIQV